MRVLIEAGQGRLVCEERERAGGHSRGIFLIDFAVLVIGVQYARIIVFIDILIKIRGLSLE